MRSRLNDLSAAHVLTLGAALTAIFLSSSLALLLGIAVGLTIGNPYIASAQTLIRSLLTWSVVALGAGMDLYVVQRAGASGFGYTLLTIGGTILVGVALGQLLKVGRDASLLITVGTAICGASAIVALAPAINARRSETSIALLTIFLLNGVALVAFPPLGRTLGLSQTQFGLWSALAIHDTSSVIGATLAYGNDALATGTTVKLARALWIIPVTLVAGWLCSHDRRSLTDRPAKRPWFILGFLSLAALCTWVPQLRPAGHLAYEVARRTFTLALFLIGTNLTQATCRDVGVRPFAFGLSLWIIVSSATLRAILAGWIR